MATPNQYATNGNPQPSDLILTYSTNNADTRKLSLSGFASWLQSYLGGGATSALKQYASPNSAAFNILVSPLVDGQSVRLLMTPTGTLASGTITLPASAACADMQYVWITSTQAITSLTIASNGATAINGAPTTLAANAYVRLEYDKVNNSWYRTA